jgi:hypothetical protein
MLQKGLFEDTHEGFIKGNHALKARAEGAL